jgi:cytoskeletal protein RodZ
MTIEQAQNATRIRGKLLRALENAEYDQLPNPGYVRGYISSYARLLELDPLPLLAMYKAESGSSRRTDLDLPHVEEAVARTGEQHAVPLRIAVIAAVALTLLTGAIWIGIRLSRGPETLPPEPVPADTPTTSPSGDTTPVGETTTATRALPFTVDVTVSPQGASWVRVLVDGRIAYEGTLTGGQSKRFEVTDECTVVVGKPSEITVLRDGRKVELPDEDTPELTMTAKTPE